MIGVNLQGKGPSKGMDYHIEASNLGDIIQIFFTAVAVIITLKNGYGTKYTAWSFIILYVPVIVDNFFILHCQYTKELIRPSARRLYQIVEVIMGISLVFVLSVCGAALLESDDSKSYFLFLHEAVVLKILLVVGIAGICCKQACKISLENARNRKNDQHNNPSNEGEE